MIADSESTTGNDLILAHKGQKRKAMKELRREAKRKKREEDVHLPGAATIQLSELAETEITTSKGYGCPSCLLCELLSEVNPSVYQFLGLRCVKDYPFTYNMNAKGRWIGRTVVHVFYREFRGPSLEQYLAAIVRGSIQVDGKMIDFDTTVSAHQVIQNRIHRHEPPVTSKPIKIIHQSDDMVVIDKPASIPVHPTGRYRHNTVEFLMAREHGITNLYPVHRLDRLTSGLLIFARNPIRAEVISAQIRNHTAVQKTYVARVDGEFPAEPITVDQPILVTSEISTRELNKVHADGKPSITHFERLFFDGRHSVVLCKPKTGRTHQIRVHLAWLGFPIANDPLYNAKYKEDFPTVWQIEDDSSSTHTSTAEGPSSSSASSNISNQGENVDLDKKEEYASNSTYSRLTDDQILLRSTEYKGRHPNWKPNDPHISIESIDPIPFCHLCSISWRMPEIFELEIFLHSMKYEGDGFDYITEMPVWAVQGWSFEDYRRTSGMVSRTPDRTSEV